MIEPSAPQRRWWPWLLLGLALIGAAFFLDDRVGTALDAAQRPELKAFAKACSKAGEGWVIAVGGIGLTALYFLLNRPQAAAKILFVALASELIGLASIIVRLFAGRTRPLNHDVPPGFYGLWHDGHWIAGQFKFSSFPSGHAATAAGLVAAAWLVNRGWAMALLPYAVLVMWSRIALEAHHLSDVLASTVLAIGMAIWLKRVLLPSVEFQFGNLNRARKKN